LINSDTSHFGTKIDTHSDFKSPDNLIVEKGTLSYSSVRKLTNTTYLRRINLSREDAVKLFPKIKSSVEFVCASDAQQRDPSRHFKIGIVVNIRDAEGRRWPVVLECLRAAGQRHVRLNKGWAAMCRGNGVSVGKCIRLDLWVQDSPDTLVTFSVV
jgi:hypothetical protein